MRKISNLDRTKNKIRKNRKCQRKKKAIHLIKKGIKKFVRKKGDKEEEYRSYEK